jgi:hypothetical protein
LSGSKVFFEDIDATGLLRPVQVTGTPDLQGMEWQQVRILGFSGKKWYIDPSQEKVSGYLKLWSYANMPGEFMWKDPYKLALIPFFQYTMKLGWRILASLKKASLTSATLWK